jgi:hypothetical protein
VEKSGYRLDCFPFGTQNAKIDTGASGNVLLRLPDILPQGLMNSLMEFEQTAHESLKLGFAEAERRLVVLGKKE